MAYEPIINLGKQPRHANGFLTKEEFGTEEFFEMVVGFDPDTSAIRLIDTTPRELMFNDRYAFFSKTSKKMQQHFRQTAEELDQYVTDGMVVEIGSNDGIMLDAWKEIGRKAIGVEPSGNVADVAIANGHTVIKKFMGFEVAKEILDIGPVDLVYAANVSCHITEFDTYIDSVARLIGNRGVFVFEDPYFLDVYEKCSYDQFYGEHTWMFTVAFLSKKLGEYGLEIFRTNHLETHGGSMRYYVAKKGSRAVQGIVFRQAQIEGDLYGKLVDLSVRIGESKKNLLEILSSVKGKRVAGFGATSKGVVVTNYCGIGPDLVPLITDTTPTKIGKYYPGSHIPIVAQEGFDYSEIEYMVNFAWNHFEEIRGLDLGFNGKWITHVPTPRMV